MLTAEQIREILKMQPHPIEGGYFVETYRSAQKLPASALEGTFRGERAIATAIHYLLTPDTFSALHRLPTDEIFHFYLGDPVEMLQLRPDGRGGTVILGPDLAAGMRLQHVVPAGAWQGSRLASGGKYALLGTTMAPGFDPRDYESGRREELIAGYPAWASHIAMLSR